MMPTFCTKVRRKLSWMLDPNKSRWTGGGAKDEYVMWLRFANAGMLTEGNLYSFEYAIQNLPSTGPMIEIGSFCGLSTNLLAHFKRKHGVKNTFITCDRWQFEYSEPGGFIGQSPVTHEEYREFVKDTFKRNVQMFSRTDLPYTIEMFSDELFAAWQENRETSDIFDRKIRLGGPISFCYIDGNHTYEFAKKDFENCDRYLEKGGFILFDDSGDDSGWEVCKVIEEIKASGKYEIIINNPNYLVRKK
jgi:hypothetical protein